MNRREVKMSSQASLVDAIGGGICKIHGFYLGKECGYCRIDREHYIRKNKENITIRKVDDQEEVVKMAGIKWDAVVPKAVEAAQGYRREVGEAPTLRASTLIRRLRRNIAFCELACEIRPVSPRCDTWGRRRKPCSIKGWIVEDMMRLEREFGVKVDRKALLNEAIELENARKRRQAESRRRLRETSQR